MKAFTWGPAPFVWVAAAISGLALMVEMVIAAALFSIIGFSFFRLTFTHPVGYDNYYSWLRTTPWRPGMPLPNGSIFPAPADLLVWLLFMLPILFHWGDGVAFSALLILVGIALYCVGYGLAASMVLFKTGPAWPVQVNVCLSLIVFSTFFYYSDTKLNVFATIAIIETCVLGILATSIIGLHRSMKRYPWEGHENAPTSIREFLIYRGLPDYHLGEPFTSLSPTHRWKPVSWPDALWLASLPTIPIAFWVAATGRYPEYPFLIWSALILAVRYYSYYMGKNRTPISLKPSILRRTGMHTLLAIAAGIILTHLLLKHTPGTAALTPLAILLITLAVIKAPPSRHHFETTGLRRLDPESAEPPTQSRKASKPFRAPSPS